MQGDTLPAPPDDSTSASTGAALLLPVDPEPVALRLTLIAILIAGSIAGYNLINLILPGQSLNIIALTGGFLIGGGLMWASEKLLKPRWPPSRFVELRPDAITILRRGSVEQRIDPMQHVNVLTWHFEIDKRAHVPRGWRMLAFALEQDDIYIPVYTFVSPEDFQAWNREGTFTLLERRSEGRGRSSGAERTDLRAAGAQRRLRVAEGARVFVGAEMTEANFRAYLERLSADFPAWMPPLPRL